MEEGVKELIGAYSPRDVMADFEFVLKISSLSWAVTMLLTLDNSAEIPDARIEAKVNE
jgi:hypothetical protein